MTSEHSARRTLVAMGLVAGAMVCAAACADLSRGEPSLLASGGEDASGPGGDADEGAGVSYEVSVQPLLVADCQSCHSSSGAASSSSYTVTGDVATDYAAAVALVDESNPAQSRLLRKAAGLGHGGGAIFPAGSPEYLTLLTWITDGALP